MTYIVETYTLCDGWVNTWHNEENGVTSPETFPTRAAAQAALDEFFAEIADEIAVGQRACDAGYDRSEFRVVKVGEP
ncbi:MAG: hypothetical protein CMN17_11840 [Roseovarius sp.]|nr:hypothetical protein [Roseovarius sp.]MBK44183.1 hypothetical protein [Roseovarius sp.]|tara:strand:- start:197 stop:427 length:231 start_codon:yes stop_codon:yes gene_type:complete